MKFAKLYDIDDIQILVRLTLMPVETMGKERLVLILTTHSPDDRELSVVLAEENEAVEVFEKMNASMAIEMRETIIEQLYN